MTRREFAKLASASAAAVAAGSTLPGCGPSSVVIRPEAPPERPGGGDALRDAILSHALLAPSSHNTQPWKVHVESASRWIVGSDASRQLAAVDPEARELVLSVGTFLEYLATAAAAHGLDAAVETISARRADSAMVALTFRPCPPRGVDDLVRIRSRRTLRERYRRDPLREEHARALLAPLGEQARWLPAGSTAASWLSEAEVGAFTRQSGRDDAQEELARWFRFSEREIEAHRDGLTLAMMEVGGVAGWFAAHFMDARSVTGKSFRERGVASATEQAAHFAGWMVITSPDESVASLLDAGRRFARMALLLRERGIAAAPMSQTMEEPPWKEQLRGALSLPGVPQFVLRLGYVDAHPDPVSPRRAPAALLG